MDESLPKTDENSAQAPPRARDQLLHPETQITGRFGQYQSGFWQLALPALSARYIGRTISQFFNWHDSPNPFLKRLYAIGTGLVMVGFTTFYAKRTLDDMKRIFSQAVGCELGKDPQEVGLRDLWKSENVIVHRTMRNFFKYNARRYATNATFFNSLIPAVGRKIDEKGKFDIYSSVDAGIGITGTYLISDVINRKETFFERLQNFIDIKINHAGRAGELITANDLIALYDMQAKENNPAHSISSLMATEQWSSVQAFFARMADLMNQTYHNTPAESQANFTIPTLIYLLGNGLLDPQKTEQSLALVEVANRYGMDAVKQMAVALQSGAKLEDILPQSDAQGMQQPAGANLPEESVIKPRSKEWAVPAPELSQVEKQAQRGGFVPTRA